MHAVIYAGDCADAVFQSDATNYLMIPWDTLIAAGNVACISVGQQRNAVEYWRSSGSSERCKDQTYKAGLSFTVFRTGAVQVWPRNIGVYYLP